MILDSIEEGININNQNVDDSEFYFNFFESMIKRALDDAKNYGINSVFDYVGFTPKYMTNFKYKDDIKIYYLANLDASIDNIEEDLINYSKEYDWPSYASKEDIERNIKWILERNELLKKECSKFNFKLVNTSRCNNRDEILEKLYEEIVN